jgi:hypothetical protein
MRRLDVGGEPRRANEPDPRDGLEPHNLGLLTSVTEQKGQSLPLSGGRGI